MGWTVLPIIPRDEKAEVHSLFVASSEAPFDYEILKSRKVGSIWFLATKLVPRVGKKVTTDDYTPDADGAITVCIVVLTSRHDGEWGYNEMSESCGPVQCHCKAPASILKLLSPTTNEYALRFRADCERWNNRPKPKPGQWVKTARLLNFGDHGVHDTFLKVDLPRRQGVYAINGGALVRLPADALIDAEILP